MHLGLDLGTSGVKAVLTDEAGAVAAQATAPLTVSRPRPGWSEQDPAAWWDALVQAVEGLRESRDLSGVRGIGLSGQPAWRRVARRRRSRAAPGDPVE